MGYVLAVALLTWGGVFLYLLRLEQLTRAVEKEVRAHQTQQSETRAATDRTAV